MDRIGTLRDISVRHFDFFISCLVISRLYQERCFTQKKAIEFWIRKINLCNFLFLEKRIVHRFEFLFKQINSVHENCFSSSIRILCLMDENTLYRDDAFETIYFVLRNIQGLITIFVNLLTIIVIVRYKRLHTSSNVLIVSLAAADFITGFGAFLLPSDFIIAR